MKEIDFLPSWYLSGRRQQISYKTQYAAILCILVVMAGWSFYTAKSVSSAQASIGFSPEQRTQLVEGVKAYSEVRAAMAEIEAQAARLAKLDSRIPVAGILGELSYLVDQSIVITDIKVEAMPFDGKDQSQNSGSVRLAEAGRAKAGTIDGAVRCRVVLRGMASQAGDVAKLICKLEESPYFMDVIPEFSRTRDFKARQVTEFELGCFLENYKEEKQDK